MMTHYKFLRLKLLRKGSIVTLLTKHQKSNQLMTYHFQHEKRLARLQPALIPKKIVNSVRHKLCLDTGFKLGLETMIIRDSRLI